jgi:hypothetical protein
MIRLFLLYALSGFVSLGYQVAWLRIGVDLFGWGTVAEPVTDQRDASGAPGLTLGVLLTCAVASGLLAGALEADMFKRIKFAGIRTSTAMSFVSFWAALAIFLGATLVRGVSRLRLVHIQIAYAGALAVYAATAWNLYALHAAIFGRLAALRKRIENAPDGPAAQVH